MSNTKFQFKRTTVSGRLPNTTNSANTSYIDAGEFAINITDRKVVSSNGSITFEVGANLSSLNVGSIFAASNVTISNSAVLIANGSFGTNSQVLISNGTGMYWGNVAVATVNTSIVTYTYNIASNTTVITGADNNSNTLSYYTGLESVYLNGSKLIAANDYTTTNTSTITLAANAVATDVVQIVAITPAVMPIIYDTANTLSIGNSTVNTTINATSFSGTANNANNLGGTSLATLQNQITGNAATAYSNAVANAGWYADQAYTNATTYSANASNLGNGTVAPARLGSGTANSSTILYGNSVWAAAPSSTNASALTTGIVNTSVLASGTANSTTILYGNSVWAAAPDGVNTAFQYTFTNTISFSSNISLVSGNGTNQLLLGTINATSIGVLANSTVLTIGNSSVNTTVNATSFSGTANNANNLGGTSLTTLQTQITGNAATAYSNATTYSSNASNISTGTLGYAYLPANVVIRSNTNTFTAVQTFNANVAIVGNTTGVLAIGSGAANLVANAVAITLSANTTDILTINTTAIQTGNSTVYSTVSQTLVNTSSLSVGGQVSVNATVASFGTVANISAPSASLTVSSITAGNLNVTGTLTTIDTQTLQVKDNFVLVADGNANVAADAVDFGIYGVANTASVTTYYGLGRVAAGNYFQLFSTTTSPSNTTIAGTSTSTLQAYLQPFGAGGAFVVNASAMALTANSTVSLSLTANTLSLSTALPTTSGGTGYGSYTAGDILYASNTSYLSKLTLGADGTVLQVQGTALAWASLDGGTF